MNNHYDQLYSALMNGSSAQVEEFRVLKIIAIDKNLIGRTTVFIDS